MILGKGALETFNNFPLRSKVFSRKSETSIKIVSGIKPQVPLLEIFISPAKCISAMSFGRVLVRRYSENIECEALDIRLSSPFFADSALLNISTISDAGRPNLASLFLYSSCPCSIRTEFTVSRINDDVRYTA